MEMSQIQDSKIFCKLKWLKIKKIKYFLKIWKVARTKTNNKNKVFLLELWGQLWMLLYSSSLFHLPKP